MTDTERVLLEWAYLRDPALFGRIDPETIGALREAPRPVLLMIQARIDVLALRVIELRDAATLAAGEEGTP